MAVSQLENECNGLLWLCVNKQRIAYSYRQRCLTIMLIFSNTVVSHTKQCPLLASSELAGLSYHSKMKRDLDSELISLLPSGYDVDSIIGFDEGGWSQQRRCIEEFFVLKSCRSIESNKMMIATSLLFQITKYLIEYLAILIHLSETLISCLPNLIKPYLGDAYNSTKSAEYSTCKCSWVFWDHMST